MKILSLLWKLLSTENYFSKQEYHPRHLRWSLGNACCLQLWKSAWRGCSASHQYLTSTTQWRWTFAEKPQELGYWKPLLSFQSKLCCNKHVYVFFKKSALLGIITSFLKNPLIASQENIWNSQRGSTAQLLREGTKWTLRLLASSFFSTQYRSGTVLLQKIYCINFGIFVKHPTVCICMVLCHVEK